jgi:hypothetical protein
MVVISVAVLQDEAETLSLAATRCALAPLDRASGFYFKHGHERFFGKVFGDGSLAAARQPAHNDPTIS